MSRTLRDNMETAVEGREHLALRSFVKSGWQFYPFFFVYCVTNGQ